MKNSSDSLLIIFIKNPQAGKVKIRLAAEIGDRLALEVYQKLLLNTRNICDKLPMQKAICYSDFVDENDYWSAKSYLKYQQQGEDLGERMKNALKKAFIWGYQKVVLIGGDIIELNADVINTAFRRLDEKEVVIGPAKDGGYYLIGMKELYEPLFWDMSWGRSEVYKDSLQVLKNNGLSYAELSKLADLDTYKDYQQYKNLIEKMEYRNDL